ncbi:hypothetical protein ACOMHN_019669 [Nucella lapillus]
MKLLLLALLGLVAMATAQDPRDFLILEEGSDPDDLDQGEIESMEEQGTPREQLNALRTASQSHQIAREVKIRLSPGYENALARGGDNMFDEHSANNEDVGGSTNSSNLAAATAAPSRTARQTLTNLYYCPHRNYLLRWFPLYVGGNLNVCFVPWATSQAITYARCSTSRCTIRNNRLGRCRPSCYRRSVIVAMCYDTVRRQWRWRKVVRNLPQACICSTC